MTTTKRPLLQTSVTVQRQGGPRREGEARPARPALTRPLRGPHDGEDAVSFAILELDIRQPPATVHRVGIGWWIVRCTNCGHQTRRHPLISLALNEHNDHAGTHVQQTAEALEDMLSTTRQPLLIVA